MGISAREVIEAGVAFLLIAIVFPIGLGQIVAANTTGWDASVKTIFQILFPILGVIGVALWFIPKVRK